MKGAFWIVGILLLIVMFIGVRMLLFSSSPAANQAKKDNDANLDDVVCWGYFDGEKGVAGLDPRQFGDVTDLVAENSKVKQGDVLLKIDDTVAKLKVKAAQQQLTQARQLTEFNKLQVRQQQSAVKAVELERDTRLRSLKGIGSEGQMKEAQELYKEKLNVEEAKLKQAELQDADLKIAQADTQLKEAEAMLKHFQITAPDDGTVLRVNVRKGETLGPNAMRHAVEFLAAAPIIVKAEVLQEWGRFIEKGQSVQIEDDIYQGQSWKGTVKSISEWYAQTRSPVVEPFRMNDVRTLECIIEVQDPGQARIGQRVRAKIHIGKQAGAQK